MQYKAKFVGRKINAGGVFYEIETTVDGADPESARINLYERYEHITKLELTPITDEVKPE